MGICSSTEQLPKFLRDAESLVERFAEPDRWTGAKGASLRKQAAALCDRADQIWIQGKEVSPELMEKKRTLVQFDRQLRKVMQSQQAVLEKWSHDATEFLKEADAIDAAMQKADEALLTMTDLKVEDYSRLVVVSATQLRSSPGESLPDPLPDVNLGRVQDVLTAISRNCVLAVFDAHIDVSGCALPPSVTFRRSRG